MMKPRQVKKKHNTMSLRYPSALILFVGLSACATVDMTTIAMGNSDTQTFSEASVVSPVSAKADELRAVLKEKGLGEQESLKGFRAATALLLKGRGATATTSHADYVFTDSASFTHDIETVSDLVVQTTEVSSSYLKEGAEELNWVLEAKHLEKALIDVRKAEMILTQVQADHGDETSEPLLEALSVNVDTLRDTVNAYGHMAWESAPRATYNSSAS